MSPKIITDENKTLISKMPHLNNCMVFVAQFGVCASKKLKKLWHFLLEAHPIVLFSLRITSSVLIYFSESFFS